MKNWRRSKKADTTVALSFHYAGNDWSTAQQQGLQDQFEKMGIEVISVTDAAFKPEQQISDIENAPYNESGCDCGDTGGYGFFRFRV